LTLNNQKVLFYIKQTLHPPGFAARLAMSVAVEMLRFYAKEKKFVAALGERLKAAFGDPRSLTFLKLRISLAVQRGNAAAMLGTLPDEQAFGELFLL